MLGFCSEALPNRWVGGSYLPAGSVVVVVVAAAAAAVVIVAVVVA